METSMDKIIKNKKAVVLKDSDSIYDAIRCMEKNSIGTVLVANSEGDCYGILTDRDIALGFVVEGCSLNTPIRDLVSEPLVFVVQDDRLTPDIILEKMIENGVRRIPVIAWQNNKKQAVAIISCDDLILHRLVSLESLAELIEAQKVGPRRRMRPDSLRHNEERRLQTYRRFLKDFMEDAGLTREESEHITLKLLKLICRRITPTEAFHFVSQLPSAFHDELLDQKAGPQKEITERTFIEETAAVLGRDELEAKEVIARFWQCLEQHVSLGELEDVLGQLPKGTRELFKKGA